MDKMIAKHKESPKRNACEQTPRPRLASTVSMICAEWYRCRKQNKFTHNGVIRLPMPKEKKTSNPTMTCQSSSGPDEIAVNPKQELISYRCLLFPSL
jgi:hypothetical protein